MIDHATLRAAWLAARARRESEGFASPVPTTIDVAAILHRQGHAHVARDEIAEQCGALGLHLADTVPTELT